MRPRDRAILNAVQREFPLDPRPCDVLARRLKIPADEVRRRLASLRRRGVVRRIGPMLDRRRLGLRGVLVAAKVAPRSLARVTKLLAGRNEVTHSYLRSGRLPPSRTKRSRFGGVPNLWFTVTLRGGERVDALVGELRALGVREVVALPTRRVFKLDASFSTEDNGRG